MNFFVCLVRLSGEPITAADRRPVTEHLASRGIDDGAGWLSDLPAPATHLELALHVTKAQGVDSAEKLLGDFAYVIWDTATRHLFAVRDAFGVKPLFYSRLSHDLLAFSSHASLLGVGGAVSEEYIAKYFVRSVSEEDTIFDPVDVVPAAHTLVVTKGRWSLRRYWCPDRFDIDPTLSGPDAVEEFRTLFADAVRIRLAGRGSVWSELSGGLDTSAVVSMSSWLQQSGSVDKGVSGTITYADSLGSGNESEWVDAVVQASSVRNEQIRDSWPWRDDGGGPLHTEKPGPCTLFWFRDRQRNEVLRNACAQVLLSGFGGDHVLEGSLRFFADRLAAGSIRRTLGEMAHWAALQQRSFWRFAFSNGFVPLLPTAVQSPLASRESHLRIPAWVADDFRKRANVDGYLEANSVPKLTVGSMPRYRADNVRRVHFLACSLPRDHPFTAYERRFPFLYRPLVELTLRFLPELKVHPNARKIALREAMRGVLPELVRTRLGKGGVDTRMLWALNHECVLIESMLQNPVLAQMGYVDGARLRHAYDEARTGKQQLTVPLYNTLALETWILIEIGRWPPPRRGPYATCIPTQKEKTSYAQD